MHYLFNNEAGYQRRQFLKISPMKDKADIIIEVGSLNELDKTCQYQLTKDEILELISSLTQLSGEYSSSSHKSSSDIQEAEIVP